MQKADLLNKLTQQNPWWEGDLSSLEGIESVKRDLFPKIIKSLDLKMITSIIGLRRTGKSTLMKQVLKYLLKHKTKNVCYFSFDKALLSSTPNLLEEIIEFYIYEHLKTSPAELKEQVYIFLDEIQYIDYWQDVIKRYYDISSKIKFIVSGSFSSYLSLKSTESLAGRVFEYHLTPLSFHEYLRLKYQKNLKRKSNLNLRLLKHLVRRRQASLSKFQKQYQSEFEDYLLTGAFPETLNFDNDRQLSYEYIKSSVFEKIIDSDIPKIFNIDKKYELSILAKCLIQDSSSIYEAKNLAQDLGIDQETCARYIESLEQACLIGRIYKYSKSLRKHARSSKKAYSASANLIAAILNIDPRQNILFQELSGKLVENYIFERLSYNFENVCFFRERESEIDFGFGDGLVKKKSDLVWLEVKYKNNVKAKDLKFFKKFLKAEGIKDALVITKDLLKVEIEDQTKIYYVPALLV